MPAWHSNGRKVGLAFLKGAKQLYALQKYRNEKLRKQHSVFT